MTPSQMEEAQMHLLQQRLDQGFQARVTDVVVLTRLAEVVRPYYLAAVAERARDQLKS